MLSAVARSLLVALRGAYLGLRLIGALIALALLVPVLAARSRKTARRSA